MGAATLSNFGNIASTASYGSGVEAYSGVTSFRVTNGAAASNAALIVGCYRRCEHQWQRDDH